MVPITHPKSIHLRINSETKELWNKQMWGWREYLDTYSLWTTMPVHALSRVLQCLKPPKRSWHMIIHPDPRTFRRGWRNQEFQMQFERNPDIDRYMEFIPVFKWEKSLDRQKPHRPYSWQTATPQTIHSNDLEKCHWVNARVRFLRGYVWVIANLAQF